MHVGSIGGAFQEILEVPRHSSNGFRFEQARIKLKPSSQPGVIFSNVEHQIKNGASLYALQYFDIHSGNRRIFKADVVKNERHSKKRISGDRSSFGSQGLDKALKRQVLMRLGF